MTTDLARWPRWVLDSHLWLEEFRRQVEAAGLEWVAPDVGCDDGADWYVVWRGGLLVNFTDGKPWRLLSDFTREPIDPMAAYRVYMMSPKRPTEWTCPICRGTVRNELGACLTCPSGPRDPRR